MREIVRFALRLPPDVHEALQALARRDRRSLHSEILHILERYIAEEMPEGAESKRAA